MAGSTEDMIIEEEDHKVAFIFTPDSDDEAELLDDGPGPSSRQARKGAGDRQHPSSSSSSSSKKGPRIPSKSQTRGQAKKDTSATPHRRRGRPSRGRDDGNVDRMDVDGEEGDNDDDDDDDDCVGPTMFIPLLNGKESAANVRLRERLFEKAWGGIEGRIQHILREANHNTLEEVGSFIRDASSQTTNDKIPAAFIITGPNIASQDLLFTQLAEDKNRQGRQATRLVRVRSAEAPNLKAILRKIIRDAMALHTTGACGVDDEEDGVEEVQVGTRKYLDYDLEALHVSVRSRELEARRVVVAFQDSEAFDSGLLADLIALFHSWRDRLPFTLLFGIATSVGLLEARLSKMTTHRLYGAQFDVVQADAVLESIVRRAVAGGRAALTLGPSLLRCFVERQEDQVAGVQVFISSLKYAYMCHFYASPLSVLLDESPPRRDLFQPELLEVIRNLGSFRTGVEAAVEAGQLAHARSLLEDDDYLIGQVAEHAQKRQQYLAQLLRSLHLLDRANIAQERFVDLYVSALADGIDLSEDPGQPHPLLDHVRRMGPVELESLVRCLIAAIEDGSETLDLPGWASPPRRHHHRSSGEDVVASLNAILAEFTSLRQRAAASGNTPLKSRYSGQSKVLRTTVVAQKVQLSRDTATLTAEDQGFTEQVDRLVRLLGREIRSPPLATVAGHEAWTYDSRSPYRDVFVPRPGASFARALGRPHDYLGCACCAGVGGEHVGGNAPTLPATAILYHLYQETGALINVADLWTAFWALVGDGRAVGGDDDEDADEDADEDEGEGKGEADNAKGRSSSKSGGGGKLGQRAALMRFYQALAELRLMGFVKPSRRKTDHIAKSKWLL